MSALEVSSLSMVARRKNIAAGLTGILIYHAEKFLHVLEGEQEAMMAMLRSVLKDRRHHDFNVVFNQPVEQRAFPTWHMLYGDPDALSKHPSAARALAEVMVPNSDLRGRDPQVRDTVRGFLASLPSLPPMAATA